MPVSIYYLTYTDFGEYRYFTQRVFFYDKAELAKSLNASKLSSQLVGCIFNFSLSVIWFLVCVRQSIGFVMISVDDSGVSFFLSFFKL